jgi:predicted permease
MSWFDRLWNSARRRDLSGEIDEELQFHIEASTRANLTAGMTPEEARRDALRRFGNPPSIQEQTRDANLMLSLEATLQDLIVAARGLRKHATFTTAALLTLALGIGANTAIFTIVRSVILRPLPFPQSDELYTIAYGQSDAGFWLYPGMWDRNYLVFRDATETFAATASFGLSPVTLTGDGDATRVVRLQVTPDFFRVLGVEPAMGRTFAPNEDQPGRDRVALVAHGLWRSRFGADSALLDRSITLDGIPHTVVGILPAGFSYPADGAIWTPLLVENKPNIAFSRPVIGRLKPGVSRAQAWAELETIRSRFAGDPGETRQSIFRLTPLQDAIVGDVRTSLLIFSGAVAFVLLIACANVANLLLIRAVSRRTEIATRLAIGAGRGRIIRQLLTESALLALAGGALGALVAYAAGPLLLRLVPAGTLPQDIVIEMDGWVLGFAVVLSVGTGLLLGLAPALHITREGPYAALREGSAVSSRRSHLLRQSLVVVEVALALVLLIGAGLLVKSYVGLRSIDPGFEPGRVMTMTLDLPATKYRTPFELNAFHQRFLESISALPDVSAAGAINWLPLGDLMVRGDLQAEGAAERNHWGMKAAVSPGYFRTIGIRLTTGRDFDRRDTAQSPGVVIISESIARRIWPNDDALGKRLTIESRPSPGDWLTVVGVVADVRQSGLREAVVPGVYLPYPQVRRPFFLSRMNFLVRTTGNPLAVAPLMRAQLHRVDSDLAPQAMATMEDVVGRTIAAPRFQSRLLGGFSIVALILAALGIYGVLASSVAERRREIGIRVALGAERSTVVCMVLRRTLVLTTAGVVLGLVSSFAVTKALTQLLYNVTPTDPMTFAIAAAVLVSVAMLAALIPARCASSVDPLVALRVE